MKRKLTAVFLAAFLILGNTAGVLAADSSDQTVPQAAGELVIYHTNDTHGYLSDGSVSIDQVAGLKDATPGSILVDAGDATQGLPLASLTKGSDVIQLMNLAGYDLMAAGNHEFDFGTRQFLTNVSQAGFPILAANVYQDGKLLLSGVQEGSSGCHTIIERNGFRIGFFGLTTTETAASANPDGIRGLEFADELETAQKEIDELEAEDVDAIIAVCHMGNTDAPCTSETLANALTGDYQDKVDVIIDGHSHTEENTLVNGILIAQTGSNMNAVGKLTLSFAGGETTASDQLLTAEDLAAMGVTAKEEVTRKLQEVEDSHAALLEEELGQLETTLWGGNVGVISIARIVETNFGDLAADAMRDAAESFAAASGSAEDRNLPVIAVENAGGIRAGAANGSVTVGDLITAFPYSNTLYLKKVTPQILYQVMEVSASMLDGQDPETGMLLQSSNSGGFLQISGFTVEYNPDAEAGNRVTAITLDGQDAPLARNDSSTQLLMVSNNYIMSGGNDYTMLGSLEKYGEAGGELEVIQAYLEKCLADGTIASYARAQERILLRGSGYEPRDYTASIRITDEAGNPLPKKELSYRVDGGERTNGTTDADGYLKIQVSDGSHGIRLADTQTEVYVDNYAGIGIVEDDFRAFPTLTFLADGSCDPIPEEPSGTPTPSPTAAPTDTPAPTPSTEPSQPTPTAEPSGAPTAYPTSLPAQEPTVPPATAAPTITATPAASGTGNNSGQTSDSSADPADTGDDGYRSYPALLAASAGVMSLLLYMGYRQRRKHPDSHS